MVNHLEAWAEALSALPRDCELPAPLVKRLRGEFTVSQRALRGEQNKGGRLREPTALSLARDALPRSASQSPRPRKRQRSPTPPPADSALEAMTGAQLRKLMARQGVGAAPAAWAADVRSLLREVRAFEDSSERVSLEDVRPAIAARGFTWTGSLPLNGTRCVISVPPAWPCYLDAWGADNSHARGCKKYIRSMASLVGYLEKCLELARDGVSVRLEGDATPSDDEANASDDATPPSVAPSQADEAEIEQARAKLLDFLEKTQAPASSDPITSPPTPSPRHAKHTQVRRPERRPPPRRARRPHHGDAPRGRRRIERTPGLLLPLGGPPEAAAVAAGRRERARAQRRLVTAASCDPRVNVVNYTHSCGMKRPS